MSLISETGLHLQSYYIHRNKDKQSAVFTSKYVLREIGYYKGAEWNHLA